MDAVPTGRQGIRRGATGITRLKSPSLWNDDNARTVGREAAGLAHIGAVVTLDGEIPLVGGGRCQARKLIHTRRI